MASTAPPDTRTWPATVGSECAMLTELLDYHRETLAWKCPGLTDEQLRARPIATTTLSLLGLVRHLTDIDRDLHVIEEYARHNGHADLLREAIDGLTGE